MDATVVPKTWIARLKNKNNNGASDKSKAMLEAVDLAE